MLNVAARLFMDVNKMTQPFNMTLSLTRKSHSFIFLSHTGGF